MVTDLHERTIVALIEAAPDGILLVDARGRIALLNEACEQLFGYRRDELVGRSVDLLVPESLRGAHAEARAGYAAAPRRRPMGLDLELCALRRDGSELPVEISLAPMPWQGETYTVTIVRDASRRRHREQRRLESARSRAVEEIVSGLEAIVWEATTPDRSTLTFLGGREDAFLGYPRTQWLREGFWLSVVHADDRLAALSFAESARREETFELEYRLIAADGAVHHVRDIVSVSRDADGEPARLRGVIIDVTERRALEAQLAQVQKMEAVGQLASGIAHDFNNLLTIVSGHARRLLRREEAMSIREELTEIVVAADRASELTRQLLAFARRGEGEPVLLDANELVRALRPMLRRLIEGDIVFDLALDEGAPRILLDRGHVEQILMNLILNARDAMAAGGVLGLASGSCVLEERAAAARGVSPGRYLLLSVSDTGKGIPADMAERIFEPFFTTKGEKGTGMGLATVQGLVAQAGGYVDVDSRPGAGTIFRVALPAAPAEDVPAPLPQESDRPTILLVEDEPALRQLAATILEEEGYAVLGAGSGSEAIALAERNLERIDLLITDVVMPGLSGPELAERLLALRPDLSVLYVSGYTDSRLVSRGVEEAQAELLLKPFTPDELAQRAGGLLRRAPSEPQ